MSKTIEEIKAEVAKEYIKSGERSTIEQLMTEVAERYAQSQNQELIEQNRELVEMLEAVADARELGGYVPVEYIRERLTKYQKP